MGIETDHALSDFCLFPKLRGCRYEIIEEMKEAVTQVIDTLTQEDIHGAFQKLSERYNKCIAAGGDYFKGDSSFMCVLSINVPIRKKSGNLSYAPHAQIIVIFVINDKSKIVLLGFISLFCNLCSEGLISKIIIMIIIMSVKLATVVEGDLKAPFSIATTPRCAEEFYSFLCIASLYP